MKTARAHSGQGHHTLEQKMATATEKRATLFLFPGVTGAACTSARGTSPLKKPQQERLYIGCVVYVTRQIVPFGIHGQPSLLPLRVGGWGRAKLCLFVTWPAQPTTPTGGVVGGWVGRLVGWLVGGAGGS